MFVSFFDVFSNCDCSGCLRDSFGIIYCYRGKNCLLFLTSRPIDFYMFAIIYFLFDVKFITQFVILSLC